jgi:hypothetical protein
MKTKLHLLSSLGLTEMKKQLESLSSLRESLREKTADILDRLGKINKVIAPSSFKSEDQN